MRFSRDYQPIKGNCFVMMPFGIKPLKDGRPFNWDEHYETVMKPEIRAVEMNPIRADDIYGAPSLIERIWRGIQEAEVVVADLTGRSPNVLYELGLAHVIGKRLIVLSMHDEDVPLDLAHFAQIRYSDQGTGLLTLTRELKKAISAARKEPAAEAGLYPLPGGGVEPVPANIVAVAEDFATVQTNDGRRAFLNAEDVNWTRRSPDLTRQFRVGDVVRGAFVVGVKGEPKYSLIATQENPWPKLETEFPMGKPFRGKVVNHPPKIGAFVRLNYGINGLIPESTVPSGVSLGEGAEVEVRPMRIEAQRREVTLEFLRVISVPPGQDERWERYLIGQLFEGIVSVNVSEKGYILVALPDGFNAMLHMNNMSPQFRSSLEERRVAVGTRVPVEIAEIDEKRRRVQLRNVANVPRQGRSLDADRGGGSDDQEAGAPRSRP